MVAKEISFPDFLRAVAIPMFGFAIVNPMGPTFMGFAIGKTNSGNSSLLFFSLNPFSQTAEEISTFNFDPHNIDADSLLKDYGLCFEIDKFLVGKKSDGQEFATPTLLFGNLGGETKEALDEQQLIVLSIIRHSNDPLRTLQNLTAYPMNVMERVSHEMSLSSFGFDNNEEKQIPSNEQLIEIIGHICNPEHIKQEFKGFNIAWEGAINFQRENGNVQLADSALGLEESLGVIGKLFPSLSQLMMEN
ncbi:hypothetical protein [Candidatus Puniceispirillum marinum]|uniref:Methyl-accepting chemotaxis transducer n=1 Tax=Puniceispirillum marinum (strain IMCC1322) TaxID=488538 RepID=D5BTC7_PUNMI|nr:hypothetical protein [Candidatus Puniceispirillum marinum]ADE39524.1 methyl-accepting chemotaxis transducer [Candidatus Puniceispirillum marinum IMCC1322]